MTRQEFTAAVMAVQAGEPGATLKLWEGARRFVAKAAHRWAHNSNGRTPHGDLMQAGFLAVLDAAERFDPEREDGSFLSVLRLTLKTRFAEESGIRACLKTFDKNGGVGDNRKKQAGAGENASIPK